MNLSWNYTEPCNCDYFDKSINNIMERGLFEMAKYKIPLTELNYRFIRITDLISNRLDSFHLIIFLN